MNDRCMAHVFVVGEFFFALTGGGYSRVVQQRKVSHQTKTHALSSVTKQAEIVRSGFSLRNGAGF